MKLGDLSLRELRAICESIAGGNCEMNCPIRMICQIADNDLKKQLDDEINEEEIKKKLCLH